MSGRYQFILRGIAFAQLAALAACSATTAVNAGEIKEGVDRGGSGGTGGLFTGGTDGARAGGPSLIDDFEIPGTWGFYSSTTSGVGYVASRSDARSPTHAGSQYDRHGTSGYQVLFRNFTVPSNTGSCGISIFIKPLSAVTGQVQITDATTKASLGTTPFQSTAAGDWFPVSVSTTTGPSAGALSVRVELDHDGSFQELLVDDLSGSCTLNP